MNQRLKNILNLIQQNGNISEEDKNSLLNSIKDVNKELEIIAFKLERTEKVKKTTAILLEETIEELEQKRKAVEAQNRELEIETALERVRAAAMSMNKSDDLLTICEVSFKELQKLGFNSLRNAIIHIPNDEQKYFMDYDYSEFTGGSVTKIDYGSHPIVDEYLKRIRGAEDAYFEVVITQDQLDDWKEFRKESGQVDDPRLDKAKALYYYLFSIGIGDIGISTFEQIDDSQINILKRFRNVFDLAYKRYADISLAESQAREAQIEAALERVRGYAMAMHNSNDLSATASMVFSELKKLGINPIRSGVGLISKEERKAQIYSATSSGDEQLSLLGTVTLSGHPVFREQYEHWLNKKNYFSALEGKDLTSYYRQLSEGLNTELKTKFENDKEEFGHWLMFSEGFLYAWSDKKYSEAELNILDRFKKVIELTFKRYIDLKKAEAQAREAQIELSLERIRAQVTAMRESTELLDIVVTMRSEFVALGHEAHYFWHMRYLPEKYEKAMTSGDGTRIGMVMTLPRHIHGDIKLIADWEKNNEPAVVFAMDVDMAVKYVEKMITLGDFQQVDPQAPTLDDIRHIGGLTFIMARTTHGEIGFSLPGTVPNPSAEAVTTLVRFAGVFDLAYKRFIDLQNAEEQNKIIQAENDRKTKELEDARQLQLSMLPKTLPEILNLDIAVFMKTATEVGGDYYDFNVDDNETLTVLVGDATGHGMMSGMMVSIMKSFFISNRNGIHLKEFFEKTNNSIKEMQLGRLMMPLIGVQINSEKLIATNAGMPSLLYFRNKSQKAGEFVINNLPLGGMKDTKYVLKAVNYEKGDTILLMSDGFAELKNSQNEQYGYLRIKEKFKSLVHKPSSEIIEELKTEASQWTNGEEPDDDLTFVVIKFL